MATRAPYDTNKATLPTESTWNAKNLSGNKETVRTWVLVDMLEEPGQREPITVRWWMARRGDGASPVYCSIWAGNRERSYCGHGKAGGYGYDKYSASLQFAIDSAGIELASFIDGCGDSASRHALDAIADALGVTKARHLVQA